MKRHKYTFPRYIKGITTTKELKILTLKFLQKQNLISNPSLSFVLKKKLSNIYIPLSKINTYCLVTGRIRYTIKHTQTSRHIFFEYRREGWLPGFFFAS